MTCLPVDQLPGARRPTTLGRTPSGAWFRRFADCLRRPCAKLDPHWRGVSLARAARDRLNIGGRVAMTDAGGRIRTSTAPAQGWLAGVPEVRVGVSSCLLGQNVRYDGGNKADPVVEALGRVFRWIPLCPEVEVGMGTPREPVVLVDRKGKPPNVRMVGVESATDWTNAMYEFASGHMARFVQQNL